MTKEQELNEKILRITMTIRTNYPELSKCIKEMPVTIPDQGDPGITIRTMESYYKSLDSLLSKYTLELPGVSTTNNTTK